jgi:hypothetical protein
MRRIIISRNAPTPNNPGSAARAASKCGATMGAAVSNAASIASLLTVFQRLHISLFRSSGLNLINTPMGL